MRKRFISLGELSGRLVSYGRTADGESFYLPVVFEFSNTATSSPVPLPRYGCWKGAATGVISVPTTALTEEQGIYFVYVKLDEEGYKKQEVRIGAGDGLRTEILSGLRAATRS